MKSQENRHFIRINVNFPVDIYSMEDNAVICQGMVLNMSAEGLYLSTDKQLESYTQIRVQLPADWGNGLVTAQVVRKDNGKYGLQFVSLEQKTREALDQVVYHNWRQHLRDPISL
ncbi:MAG TPA: PilZ domain-containing protein [Methylomusa anaerophila]|uniref:PilZ domain protein n=1 Tax=Methylomusa anaerophila TaxID=1930071 RepID=A0A348AFT3_9FIRM|nr:PilZ domain-containing protein [Methylomusa anaerophila]BBB89931.1 PilZ domain protein [Methylomusa anaerophila]HML88342.1 PilZ domain-containing protein [Methylomusa anaerophila]